MRISTGLAVLSLMMAGSAALAQPAEAPAGTGPVVPGTAPTSREMTSTGSVTPDATPAGPRAEPDRTGPDVVNGLTVPKMKNPSEGGRE